MHNSRRDGIRDKKSIQFYPTPFQLDLTAQDPSFCLRSVTPVLRKTGEGSPDAKVHLAVFFVYFVFFCAQVVKKCLLPRFV